MNIVDFPGDPRGRRVAFCAFALGLACATWGGAAWAAVGAVEVVSVTVRYHDLDVRKPDDAQRLLRRIQYAAERVCGEESRIDLSQWADMRRCRADAVGRAVRDADIPTLTAIAPTAPTVLAGR